MSNTSVKDLGELQKCVGSERMLDVLERNEKIIPIARDNAANGNGRPATRASEDDVDLPPIKSARQLVRQNLALPDVVVHGLLHKGSKMVLGGGSKSFKTWGLGDLAISVANGVPWWGIETNKGRVLYINFEIQEGFFAHRLHGISGAKGMGEDALENLDVWTLRGHCSDLSKLMKKMLKEVAKDKYALIIVDPIYKGLGGKDENNAGAIGELLNEVERLAVQTGAAVVFGAHFSKGNQAAKESIDRISGSGVFARDPDTILTMTKHDNEFTYTVDSTLRNFAPMEPFCVKWIHPLMQRDEDADPNHLKVPGKKVEKFTYRQLLDILGDQEITTTGWYLQVSHQTGMSKSTFMEKLKKIKDDPTVLVKTADDKWKAVKSVEKDKVSPEVR